MEILFGILIMIGGVTVLFWIVELVKRVLAISQKEEPEKAAMAHRSRILVDVDGTIFAYDGKYSPCCFGLPLSGAKEALMLLKAAGFEIVLFTCRSEDEKPALFQHIVRHGFAQLIDDCICGKPPAFAYVDDRGYGINPVTGWAGVTKRIIEKKTKQAT